MTDEQKPALSLVPPEAPAPVLPQVAATAAPVEPPKPPSFDDLCQAVGQLIANQRAMQDTLNNVQQQLQLTQQMAVRHDLSILEMTKGQMKTFRGKNPKAALLYEVMDSPDIFFKVKSRASEILGGNGQAILVPK